MEKTGKQGERVEYIDIAKALAILCVLMGHTVDSNTFSKTVLYAFHMPVFFILSGMVIQVRPEYSITVIKEAAWKRIAALIIPYVLWGCIYAKFSFVNLAYIAYGTRETLICAGTLTSLWFLPVMFLANVIVETIFWQLSSNLRDWKIVIAGGLCFLIGMVIPHWSKYGDPWGIDIAFTAAAFMLLGFLLRPLFDRLQNASVRITFVFSALGILLLLLGMHYNITSIGFVLMANAIYGNVIFFAISAIGGGVLLLSVSNMLARIPFEKNWLLYIGKNTLGVFFIHKPIVELERNIVSKLGINYNIPVIFLAISLIGLGVSIAIVYIISRFVPVLIGKDKMHGMVK